MKSDADILAESREYIEENDWTRGQTQDGLGRVCSLGGILFSQGWHSPGGDMQSERVEDAARLCKTLMRAIEPSLLPNWGRKWENYDCIHFVTHWNDNSASGMQEVLDTFMKAEKIERAGFDPDVGAELSA